MRRGATRRKATCARAFVAGVDEHQAIELGEAAGTCQIANQQRSAWARPLIHRSNRFGRLRNVMNDRVRHHRLKLRIPPTASYRRLISPRRQRIRSARPARATLDPPASMFGESPQPRSAPEDRPQPERLEFAPCRCRIQNLPTPAGTMHAKKSSQTSNPLGYGPSRRTRGPPQGYPWLRVLARVGS